MARGKKEKIKSSQKEKKMDEEKKIILMGGDHPSIGQELLDDSPLSDIDRKCMSIKKCVEDADFSLEYALEIYEVSKEDYTDFIERSKIITIVNIKKEFTYYDIYIGRANKWLGLEGSKWGNPFVMKNESQREGVLKAYRDYVLNSPELIAALPELQGKILGCYCAPKRCHGNVLKELVEEFVK